VVNVYRLITRNTLEEKIMSLQRFKLHTARTVISADNASFQTMATDQVKYSFRPLVNFQNTGTSEKFVDRYGIHCLNVRF
jgi:TATA-binding protein-associated factor